jgi:hypothetical protein
MPPTAIVRHQAEKNGLVQWPDRRVRSHTAPSPSTVTMVQPRSAIAISRPAPRPTNAPPSCHPLRHRSQIPIDSPPARHRRATPARGFLPRGFSDACRPSTRPRSSAAGIQEALTKDACRPSTRPRSSAAGIQEALTKAVVQPNPIRGVKSTHSGLLVATPSESPLGPEAVIPDSSTHNAALGPLSAHQL